MSRVIGLDGCRYGWIGVSLSNDDFTKPEIYLFQSFKEVSVLGYDIIAVDMPIGLPDFIEGAGRGPEQLIRPLLGKRQSSVFSIPSRKAVMESDYRQACKICLETSNPPKKVSKQGFYLFPKIREIDVLMTCELDKSVYEVHPELAFWRLNDEQTLETPKKIKGRVNSEGIEERQNLLLKQGFNPDFLAQKPLKGAVLDDFIDACACAIMASRILKGQAASFPERFERDGKGLKIAIWA